MLIWYQEYGPDQFKLSSILGSFLGDPPIVSEGVPEGMGAPVCMKLSSNTETIQYIETSSTKVEATSMTFLHYAILQTPFLYPPPFFVSNKVLETITLPNMAFEILVWYLLPPAMLGSSGITSIGITPIAP